MKNLSLLCISALLITGCADQPASITSKIDCNPQGVLLSDKIVYESVMWTPGEEQAETDDWYQNIPMAQRKEFVETIMQAVRSKKLKAYIGVAGIPSTSDDDELSSTEFEALFIDSGYVIVTDPDTHDETKTLVVETINPEDIDRVTFVEQWYFDKKNLTMDKKVLGIAFSRSLHTQEGEFIGYKRLFYVWFDSTYSFVDVAA